jgi:hypothetical protein
MGMWRLGCAYEASKVWLHIINITPPFQAFEAEWSVAVFIKLIVHISNRRLDTQCGGSFFTWELHLKVRVLKTQFW